MFIRINVAPFRAATPGGHSYTDKPHFKPILFTPLFSVLSGCVYVCRVCACCPGRSEEMVEPLELEFQMAVNSYVGAEN